jgi:hypothetical protein
MTKTTAGEKIIDAKKAIQKIRQNSDSNSGRELQF